MIQFQKAALIFNKQKFYQKNKMLINYLQLYLILILFFQIDSKNSLILIENKEYVLKISTNHYLRLSLLILEVIPFNKTQNNAQ